MKKHILITGVSSGIGYGALAEFVSRGYHVYGSVRKQKDADKLQAEFGPAFTPLIFDVTDQVGIDRAKSRVEQELSGSGLVCLINNSGIAIGGPLLYQNINEISYHFDVNVVGLLRVSKAFLPLLGARENHPVPVGRMINISSVAGKIAQPFVGAYVGSKHAVEGISHSLRRELLIYDIDVIVVGPGAVNTPIWDKGINMEKYSATSYGKILKGFAKFAKKGGAQGFTIDYLGKRIADIAESKRPRVRYAIVPQSLTNWTIPSLMPHRMIDRYIKKKLMR